MEIAKCLRCEKLFNQVRLPVCPECEKVEDREIFEVQRYLRDNPNSSLEEVSDALHIYLEDISRWIEEARLHVEVTSNAALKCAMCGRAITTGRICGLCQDRIFSEGGSASPPEKEKKDRTSQSTGSFRDRVGDSGSVRKYRRS